MKISGFTNNTPQRLLLDAGAWFKDFDVNLDTVATAAAKLLGATRGGGEFNAKPISRDIEVDGVQGKAKGLSTIDAWEVMMKATLLEVTPQSLIMALGAGDVDTGAHEDYDKITGRNVIELTDYANNITWIGRLSGSLKPVIIQIFNALSLSGLKLATADKAEATLPVEFFGSYDAADLETPPFAIWYPKAGSAPIPATVSMNIADNATDVEVDTAIIWTFSKPILPSCVDVGHFLLVDEDGNAVSGQLTQSVDRTVVTFVPALDLTASTKYIAIAAKTIQDIDSLNMEASLIRNFTTASA